jgi:hypothetical protein
MFLCANSVNSHPDGQAAWVLDYCIVIFDFVENGSLMVETLLGSAGDSLVLA